MRGAALALVALLAACDGGASGPAVADDAGVDAGPADAAIPTREIDRVRARFGRITTVAGGGRYPEKAFNGWLPAYEGGPATDAELSRPHLAMADAAGDLYIADKDAHAIRRVDAQGRITTVAGTNAPGDGPDGPATAAGLFEPNGLWVQPDGTLYILDLGNAAIRIVTPDGQLTTLLRDPAGMGAGRGLWVDATGDRVIYAAGDALRAWRRGAGIQTLATGFESLGNLTVDPEGFVVVTDRLAHRVYRIVDGERIPIAGTGGVEGGGDGRAALSTGLAEVRAVAFDPIEGGYFLGTHVGSQVWYVDTEGTIHLFIDGDDDDVHAGDGGPFDAPGPKVSEVRGITIAPNGDLLITENDRGFVRRVAAR